MVIIIYLNLKAKKILRFLKKTFWTYEENQYTSKNERIFKYLKKTFWTNDDDTPSHERYHHILNDNLKYDFSSTYNFQRNNLWNNFHNVKTQSMWVSHQLDHIVIEFSPTSIYAAPFYIFFIYKFYAYIKDPERYKRYHENRIRGTLNDGEFTNYRTHRDPIYLSDSDNLQSSIDYYYKISGYLAERETILRIHMGEFRKYDDVLDFFRNTQFSILRNRFMPEFHSYDPSLNLYDQNLSLTIHGLVWDSFDWAQKIVEERGLKDELVHHLAQMRININLIESYNYAEYLVRYKYENAALVFQLAENLTKCYFQWKGII